MTNQPKRVFNLLEKVPANLPVMLDYKTMAADGSLYNTPPCWSVYIVGLVLKWLKEIGGLPEIARRNQAKAGLVYQAIDESGGFYRGHAKAEGRSVMNVTFRLPNEQLEEQFALRLSAGFTRLRNPSRGIHPPAAPATEAALLAPLPLTAAATSPAPAGS